MGIVSLADLKSYLDLSGSDDDARLTFALSGADSICARHCGRSAFTNSRYCKDWRVSTPGAHVLTAPIYPVLETPRLQLAIGDSGFRFADSDVSAAANTIRTRAGGELGYVEHDLETGDGPLRLHTTGVLPAGLSADTDYFAVRVNDYTISLALSVANAEAGTVVDLTASAGSGTHRLVGPMLDDDEFYVEYPSGIVDLGPFWPGPRSLLITAIYSAGYGADADAVKAAEPGLHLAVLEQAAWQFRQQGKGGRLGLLTRDGGGAVGDSFAPGGLAPGIAHKLEPFRRRGLA